MMASALWKVLSTQNSHQTLFMTFPLWRDPGTPWPAAPARKIPVFCLLTIIRIKQLRQLQGPSFAHNLDNKEQTLLFLADTL